MAGALQHVADHAFQAQLLAVVRRIDPRHAVIVQFLDLGRHDHAATAAEDLDVAAAALLEHVDHVLEVLDVPALVGTDGDAVSVLLQRRGDHFLYRAVVAQVDHLATQRLQQAAHDVDRGVVAVEQRSCGNETQILLRCGGPRGGGRFGLAHGRIIRGTPGLLGATLVFGRCWTRKYTRASNKLPCRPARPSTIRRWGVARLRLGRRWRGERNAARQSSRTNPALHQ